MENRAIKLSVIIPAYNESRAIGNTLKKTIDCFKKNKLKSFEIIVVDDGSRDGTAEATAKAIKAGRLGQLVKLISYSPNQGKGWALRQGVEVARGEFIAFFDADLDIAPQHIPDYLEVLLAEKVDAVIASKRHPGSRLEYAKSRVFISNLYYWFNRVFFSLDVKDTQSGMKLFKREVLIKALPRLLGKRFAFDLELLVAAKRDGAKILEQAVTIENHREFGRIGFISLWHAFVDTLAIFYRARIQGFYDREYLPLASQKKALPSVALCVLSQGYGKKIEALASYLSESFEGANELFIIAPQVDFQVAGARVISSEGMTKTDLICSLSKMAKSDGLLFFDEDARPDYSVIRRLKQYLQNEELNLICGPFEIKSNQPLKQLLGMRVLRHPLTVTHPYLRYNLSKQRRLSNAWINNLCIRKRAIKKKFEDEVHGWAIWEDRLFTGEKEILYTPDLAQKRRVANYFWPMIKKFWRLGFEKACLLETGSPPLRILRLRGYLPAFALIALVIGTGFSLFSAYFWTWWRWVLLAWLAGAIFGSGYLLRFHTACLIGLGVISGTIATGAGFLKGIFCGRRSDSV